MFTVVGTEWAYTDGDLMWYWFSLCMQVIMSRAKKSGEIAEYEHILTRVAVVSTSPVLDNQSHWRFPQKRAVTRAFPVQIKMSFCINLKQYHLLKWHDRNNATHL